MESHFQCICKKEKSKEWKKKEEKELNVRMYTLEGNTVKQIRKRGKYAYLVKSSTKLIVTLGFQYEIHSTGASSLRSSWAS